MAVFKLNLMLAVGFFVFPKGDATCASSMSCSDHSDPLTLKVIAIAGILVSSMIGVCAPFLTRSIKALHPKGKLFLVIKAFASGIILATGFMHVLPDSFAMLSAPCLNKHPWHMFPFSGFVAMLSAVLTMMVDSIATSFYSRKSVAVEQEFVDPEANNGGHYHCHESSHGSASGETQLLRFRVIAMVLELGIVVHSVVIGLSLGASSNVCTIRGLVAALCFHQMFEGLGLGGCILQAEFKLFKKAIMAFFFSVTTPFGIALGIALSKVYKPDSPKSFIIEGLLNACSAGLLIYMALVDLLAVEFMGKRLQSNIKLLFVCSAAVMVGAGSMSVLAKWA